MSGSSTMSVPDVVVRPPGPIVSGHLKPSPRSTRINVGKRTLITKPNPLEPFPSLLVRRLIAVSTSCVACRLAAPGTPDTKDGKSDHTLTPQPNLGSRLHIGMSRPREDHKVTLIVGSRPGSPLNRRLKNDPSFSEVRDEGRTGCAPRETSMDFLKACLVTGEKHVVFTCVVAGMWTKVTVKHLVAAAAR